MMACQEVKTTGQLCPHDLLDDGRIVRSTMELQCGEYVVYFDDDSDRFDPDVTWNVVGSFADEHFC